MKSYGNIKIFSYFTAALWLVGGLGCQTGSAQIAGAQVVRGRIDNTKLHRLEGNTRPEATAANDAGRVDDSLVLDHILLQLRRTPEQEAALAKAVDDLHNPSSASFHQWLTPAEFGAKWGVSAADREAVVNWLTSEGFTVNSVDPGGMVIDFSGTAGTVRQALHTEIHRLNVNGAAHIANMSDPQIPEALSPVVAGIVSLHDFMPHAMKKAVAAQARGAYTYTSGSTSIQAVTPGDLAKIYDFGPAYASGLTGTGQTIVVIEDTDVYKATDFTIFRSTFGLTAQYPSGSLSTVHPAPATGRTNCTDPGVVAGNDAEAILDAEYASAAAPNAAIELASCADTRTTFGGLIALQNLVNSSTPPTIVSISYGECEAENGASSNAAFNSLYSQAVMEGVSVFVSAGDEGAASCDAGADGATHGVGVSAFASTPYNVAVGGTDFGDTVTGAGSTYWNKTNSSTFESAISYIPEIPWNDSCAGALLAGFYGFSQSYGTTGFCGSSTASKDGFLAVAAGSGGPSGCATGSPSSTGIVSGSCAGYGKPSYQSGVSGIPADKVRDMPDVSLFAANGIWGHYYVFCWSDIRNGGASCSGAPSTWAGAGGTSFASPILAGIQALINQKYGKQGNPDYVYYRLAASSAASSVFHSVVNGDMAVNCGGSQSCFGASAPSTPVGRHGFGGGFGGASSAASDNGVLSTADSADNPAYGTGSNGWNFANGLGSVDVYELIQHWSN